MRTASILVFIACFAFSIRAEAPYEHWQNLVFAGGSEAANAGAD